MQPHNCDVFVEQTETQQIDHEIEHILDTEVGHQNHIIQAQQRKFPLYFRVSRSKGRRFGYLSQERLVPLLVEMRHALFSAALIYLLSIQIWSPYEIGVWDLFKLTFTFIDSAQKNNPKALPAHNPKPLNNQLSLP